MALFIDGVQGMPKVNGPKKGSRWIRVDGAVRLIDTPNSRMGLEVDLGLLPWDPFDALGKKVTVLVPSQQSENGSGDEDEDDLRQAIRFVGHAADRCKEFAEAGNGDSSDWWKAYHTWDWLRDHLNREWAEEDLQGETATPETETEEEHPELPSLPGAASILEYTLGALRTIPLQHWEATVATLDPEAPSREEAIRTVQILSRLLRKASPEDSSAEPGSTDTQTGVEPFPSSSQPHPEDEGVESAPRREPEVREDPEGEEEDGMSFEYAHGFDEGYQKGRRVGFALGNHARKKGRKLPDSP